MTRMYYNNFNCGKCQYITCSKCDFDNHILSKSHLYIIDIPEPCFHCICGKKYKFENIFYRHTKVCEILIYTDNKKQYLLYWCYLKKYFRNIKIFPK